jgi:hypothetical protein
VTSYEVRTGRRRLSVRTASTAHEALQDYLRGQGCNAKEIVRMGVDKAAWRGAVYSAAPVATSS